MQQTLLQQRDYVPSREFTRRMLARFRLRGSTFSGVRLAALVLDPSVAARLQGAGNSAFPGLTGPKVYPCYMCRFSDIGRGRTK